jgi:hypothetical protein
MASSHVDPMDVCFKLAHAYRLITAVTLPSFLVSNHEEKLEITPGMA